MILKIQDHVERAINHMIQTLEAFEDIRDEQVMDLMMNSCIDFLRRAELRYLSQEMWGSYVSVSSLQGKDDYQYEVSWVRGLDRRPW